MAFIQRAFAALCVCSVLVGCGEPAVETPPLRAESPPEELPTPASGAPSTVEDPSDAIAVAGGQGFSCALQRAGRVACWGQNHVGQLGQSHTDAIEGAVFVADLTDATAIAAELRTACALRRNGHVVCWGDNRSGARGTGNDHAIRGPMEVPGLDGVDALSADQGFCALRADGLWCWGNVERRIMPGVAADAHIVGPTAVALPGVTRIRSGRQRRIGFSATGARTWTFATDPVALPDVTDAVAASNFECVRRDDEGVECVVGAEPIAPVESLRGARTMVADPHGYVTALLPSGELTGHSLFEHTPVAFDESAGVVALSVGHDGPLTAGPGDQLRQWSGTGLTRTATPIAWPSAVDAATVTFGEGPIPRFCTIESLVLPVEAEGPLLEVTASLYDEDDGVADIASLCEASGIQAGSLDCPQAGPWLASARYRDYGDLSFFRATGPGRVARFPRIAERSEGYEEAVLIERLEVRGPGGAFLDVSEMSRSCDESDLCGMSTDARVHYLMELLPNGELLLVTARIAVDRAVRALGLLPADALFARGGRIEVEQNHVNVWACGGRTRLPIPVREPSAAAPGTAVVAEESTVTGPLATPEEAAAAAETCNTGWARFGEGDLEGAGVLIDEALAVLSRAEDPRGRRGLGACLYNRGRLAEAAGHTDEAMQFYRRSLSARPNPAVEARLESLSAPTP